MLHRAVHAAPRRRAVLTALCLCAPPALLLRNRSTFFTDVLVFDTTTNRVSRPVSKLPGGVRARSNHTATLVGSRIWFIAGNDTEDVFGDVITLDTVSHTWAMERVKCARAGVARVAGGVLCVACACARAAL
jgi:hypothetical protein